MGMQKTLNVNPNIRICHVDRPAWVDEAIDTYPAKLREAVRSREIQDLPKLLKAMPTSEKVFATVTYRGERMPIYWDPEDVGAAPAVSVVMDVLHGHRVVGQAQFTLTGNHGIGIFMRSCSAPHVRLASDAEQFTDGTRVGVAHIHTQPSGKWTMLHAFRFYHLNRGARAWPWPRRRTSTGTTHDEDHHQVLLLLAPDLR